MIGSAITEREMLAGRGPFWSDSIGFPFCTCDALRRSATFRFIRSRRDETESPVAVRCAPLSGCRSQKARVSRTTSNDIWPMIQRQVGGNRTGHLRCMCFSFVRRLQVVDSTVDLEDQIFGLIVSPLSLFPLYPLAFFFCWFRL